MARTKYRQKPQFWMCTQYSGTNAAEMVAACPQCHYDAGTNTLTFNQMTVLPTMWILEDLAGIFTMMINEQFVAFFDLAPGGP